jgi:hypothetical protein
MADTFWRPSRATSSRKIGVIASRCSPASAMAALGKMSSRAKSRMISEWVMDSLSMGGMLIFTQK